MKITPRIARRLGTMITYGFVPGGLARDLSIAHRLGASCLEILPLWKALPDPLACRSEVADAGMTIQSAHGCWGGQSIRARRVDLASLDEPTRLASVDDLRRCVDWLREAGGTCLIVHPGGLSDRDEFDARRAALVASLHDLAVFAEGSGVTPCVENMPPGVFPGSRMADLAAIVAEVGQPGIGLAIDTGHAHLTASPASETEAAGSLLRATHVHDNQGRGDVHLPPGLGTVDWAAWVASLDVIDYRGPIMLECIRHIRDHPECVTDDFLGLLRSMTEIA